MNGIIKKNKDKSSEIIMPASHEPESSRSLRLESTDAVLENSRSDNHFYRIRCEGITKVYPGVVANDQVSLAIQPGEIHALLGENGAGKSTLMKILYGVTQPDSGHIWFDGQPHTLKSPAHARRLGIGMVFQHFSLFETLTVVENIALSMDKREAGQLKDLARRIEEISSHYGMPIDPHRHVHSLSTGERQRVEIIRCLVQDISLLILDEPTSVLTPQEVSSLFSTLRKLAAEGCSLLFISHKLQEVKALCDRATVLRHGKIAGTCDPKTTSTEGMASMMVGSQTTLGQRYSFSSNKVEDKRLAVKGLTEAALGDFGTALQDIRFSVKPGEILGIAGVAGNGQKELIQLLSGERLATSPDFITLDDQAIGKLTPGKRRRLGMAVVPEERLGRGAVPDMSLSENGLLTGFLQNLVSRGFLRQRRIHGFANDVISNFRVKAHGNSADAKSLSGGNLQKFIIGREILQNPKLLICASPTWGVDVGAANLIHQSLIDLRDKGTAIVVLSEDLDELFQVSDRIGALCHGKLSPVKPVTETSINEVGQWMAGVFNNPKPEASALSRGVEPVMEQNIQEKEFTP
ncbi:ABC transporter ATP-binding protein [Endozoicomonas atrinae]|uniref:ABC transporter ATP-binding protein n=1 Tax=Endozoicomonas atrinae TaxID=1333660 RepID=UPI0008259930|nr:ABC transporter ATP-binding protein [Endozoicomonas atrinae]